MVVVVRNGNCNKMQLLVHFRWLVLSEDTIKYGYLISGKNKMNTTDIHTGCTQIEYIVASFPGLPTTDHKHYGDGQ